MVKILNDTNTVKFGEIVFSEINSTLIFDINLIPDDWLHKIPNLT